MRRQARHEHRSHPTNRLRGAIRPLGQMVLARLREFYREPEAVFWVYGFPILMVVALGIAFRNKPVEQIRVDVQEGPAASTAYEALTQEREISGSSL